jgi:hypothetical protein
VLWESGVQIIECVMRILFRQFSDSTHLLVLLEVGSLAYVLQKYYSQFDIYCSEKVGEECGMRRMSQRTIRKELPMHSYKEWR